MRTRPYGNLRCVLTFSGVRILFFNGQLRLNHPPADHYPSTVAPFVPTANSTLISASPRLKSVIFLMTFTVDGLGRYLGGVCCGFAFILAILIICIDRLATRSHQRHQGPALSIPAGGHVVRLASSTGFGSLPDKVTDQTPTSCSRLTVIQ